MPDPIDYEEFLERLAVLPDHVTVIPENLANAIRAILAKNAKLRRCLLPVVMGIAEMELSGEPLADDAVVLTFMGSGASDRVTARDIREAFGNE
ncbi:unnamed protein product [Sphagnum jensenii]